MSRTTDFLGGHQWTFNEDPRGGAHDWECKCGERGRIAHGSGTLMGQVFVQQSFARHAYRKLEEAAAALVLQPLPHTRQVHQSLLGRAKSLQAAGNTDQGNILMMAANERCREIEEANEAAYRALTWYPWPEEGSPGLAADVDNEPGVVNFWMYVHPGQDCPWSWETWKIDPGSGQETKLTQGSAPSQTEAQRASWAALVAYQEDQEDEEPF